VGNKWDAECRNTIIKMHMLSMHEYCTPPGYGSELLGCSVAQFLTLKAFP